jgi:hypothetical protein
MSRHVNYTLNKQAANKELDYGRINKLNRWNEVLIY